jgi:hypothetical protein
MFRPIKVTPVAGTGSNAGLNELPVRAWQAVAEMRDTPPHMQSLLGRPFPSRWEKVFKSVAWMYGVCVSLADTGDI